MFSLLFLVTGSILLQGLRKIPAKPPHKGQATRFGKKIPGKFYDEGWGFFLFYPYVTGFIPIKVERIAFDVISEKTRTSDRSESKIPVSLTIRPIPELLVEYIDSGEETGVKHQLTGKILERIREWASGVEEGPADWIELNRSQLEAVSVLVKQIAGNSLTEIPDYAQDVPTWIWLQYFSKPRPTRFSKNEEPWAENNWSRVKETLDKLSTEEVQALEAAVKERRKEIEALRTGSGKIILKDLGIYLERLNLGDIDVLGKVGEQAEEEAKEEQQRKAEALELKFVMERMTELMDEPFLFTNAEARDIVQTERHKVVRAINDNNISLNTSTAEIVAKVLGGVLGGQKK